MGIFIVAAGNRRTGAFCLSVGLAALSLSQATLAQAPKPGAPVTVESVHTAITPQLIEASGPVVAWEEMSIGARVPGVALTEVLVRIGDTVTRGQVLARLDTALLKSDVAQEQARVEEARAVNEEAANEAVRAKRLVDANILTDQLFKQTLTKASVAKAQLAHAEAALGSAQLKLDQAQVIAPDAGVISARSAMPGTIVAQGSELFRLIRQNKLEWHAELSAAQLAGIVNHQKAHILSGETSVDGEVRAVSPTLDPVSRQGTAYVDIKGSPQIRAGMYVKGTIEEHSRQVILAPAQSVVIRDGRNLAVTYVAAKEGGIARFVPVMVGARVGSEIEILSGLTPESRVIVQGAGFLSEGSKVEAVQSDGVK